LIGFTENSDERPILNAELVTKQLAAADHTLNALRKIKSDWLQIKKELALLVQSQSLLNIFLSGEGGVGICDRISEGTEGLLDSFGELLRSLLFPAVGPRAMPADPKAIDIALQKLVLPQQETLATQQVHGR
jgi:molybdopterin biosynthesis enzyme MoaB